MDKKGLINLFKVSKITTRLVQSSKIAINIFDSFKASKATNKFLTC